MQKDVDYKIIIPNLVSLQTNLKSLKGFYFSRDLDNFGNSDSELKFGYKVLEDKNIKILNKYDFKNSNYQVKDNIWTYGLVKFGFNFSFQYDYLNKELRFKPIMNKLPVRINWTHPIGDYLSDIINLELFLGRIIFLNGMAFKHNGRVIVIAAPSLNGKTTFLKKNRSQLEIISDDYILLDLNNNKVIVTPLEKKGKINLERSSYPVEKVYFAVNSRENVNPKINWNAKEFVKMNAMKFSENVLVRNLIFYYGLGYQIENILGDINASSLFKIINIKEYDYEQFLRG